MQWSSDLRYAILEADLTGLLPDFRFGRSGLGRVREPASCSLPRRCRTWQPALTVDSERRSTFRTITLRSGRDSEQPGRAAESRWPELAAQFPSSAETVRLPSAPFRRILRV